MQQFALYVIVFLLGIGTAMLVAGPSQVGQQAECGYPAEGR